MHKILSVCQTCLRPPLPPLSYSHFLSRSTFAFAVETGGAEGIPWTGTNIVESLRYSVWTLKSIKWQIEFRQKMAIGGHKNYMSFCRELQSTRHQRECQFNNCSNNNSNNNKGNNSKRKQKTTKITKRRSGRRSRRLFATGQPTVHSVPGLAN